MTGQISTKLTVECHGGCNLDLLSRYKLPLNNRAYVRCIHRQWWGSCAGECLRSTAVNGHSGSGHV